MDHTLELTTPLSKLKKQFLVPSSLCGVFRVLPGNSHCGCPQTSDPQI